VLATSHAPFGANRQVSAIVDAATSFAIDLAEQGLLPDPVVRRGIRNLLTQRLRQIRVNDCEKGADSLATFIEDMCGAEVAPLPAKANEQHYELPAAFFDTVLGPHRKYSCCYWGEGIASLGAAEDAALRITVERAGISDGMSILELGCGWGALTLWLAARFPAANITAVSNSSSQREFILEQARRRGLGNVDVITCDMNDFDTGARFDRVVSLEMFEHMRNYDVLFGRIHNWLKPAGKFFMHIFVHRSTPYAFVESGPSDWMTRHFFAGGMMPSDDLPLHFQKDLKLVRRWRWDGRHYEKTLNAWLANMDATSAEVRPILAATYGAANARQWWMRWRMFFMACAELFGFDGGQQWWVSHYLFERPAVVDAR